MFRNTNHRRGAFTLVEMMVAMALLIVIMVITAEAFTKALDTMRSTRAQGAMMDQLRSVNALLSDDLSKWHFLPDENKPNRGVKLSDQWMHTLTNGGSQWLPPTGGFFRIISPDSLADAYDPQDGTPITTARDHALHFTSIVPPNERTLYSATLKAPTGVNPSTYTVQSPAAEIAYVLVDSGSKTSVNGYTLYNLIRRQRLVALNADMITSFRPPSTVPQANNTIATYDQKYFDVLASPGGNTVHTLADLPNPLNRLQVKPTEPFANLKLTGTREGEDIILSNVLSFEVKVEWTPNQGGVQAVPGSTQGPRPTGIFNADYPFDTLLGLGNAGQNTLCGTGGVRGVFDTWYPVANWNVFVANDQKDWRLPLAIRVKAIKVTIRIWDPKTRTARQSTTVHSL
jgi:type II secretory pathway pseudopilin PulG